jgi:hypothetical protein
MRAFQGVRDLDPELEERKLRKLERIKISDPLKRDA